MQTREKTKETKINKEEKDKMRNKKGISLIVLVITIIVMIILAAAVIISLSNTGIINRANEAVNETNIAEVQHLASLAWSEAYLDNMNLPEKERNEEIKKAVEKALTDNKLNPSDYNLTYGTGGVTVAVKSETKWKVERTTNDSGIVTKVVVTNGIDTYDVGTVVNYMPEGVGPENAKYTGTWKILGADEEGRLLIMSTSSITGSTLKLSASTLEEAKTTNINALTILQDTVKDYMDGTIGISVRSITAEDLNKVVGFDPKTYTAEFLGVTGIKPYGIEVSYSWNSTGVGYSWQNGNETKTGNLEYTHDSGFIYYDETSNTFITSAKSTTGDIVTLRQTAYTYDGTTFLDSNTDIYEMLFGNINTTKYWLASRSTHLGDNMKRFAMYGLFNVNYGCVYWWPFVFTGDIHVGADDECEVRAVVTLASDVKLTESTTTAGTYDISM